MFRIGMTVGSGIRQLGRIVYPDEVAGGERVETTAGWHHMRQRYDEVGLLC
jgi:hypothetical protein